MRTSSKYRVAAYTRVQIRSLKWTSRSYQYKYTDTVNLSRWSLALCTYGDRIVIDKIDASCDDLDGSISQKVLRLSSPIDRVTQQLER